MRQYVIEVILPNNEGSLKLIWEQNQWTDAFQKRADSQPVTQPMDGSLEIEDSQRKRGGVQGQLCPHCGQKTRVWGVCQL